MPAIGATRRRAVNARRPALALLCTVLAFALGGCSAGLLYDRLDTLIAWYVEDHVELVAAQRQELRRLIGGQLDWHRATQLPAYAERLAALQREATQPMGRESIDRALADIDGFWTAAMGNVAPDAARFLAGLSDAQIDGMFREFAEDDAKRRRKLADATPEERLERRTKRTVRSIERWTGRLDDAQRAQVAASIAAAEPLEDAWLANRARWREQFREHLAQRDQPGFATEVRRLLVEPETAWNADYRAATERNRERYVTLVAELDRTLTPRQREHLRRQLANWATDLRELAEG